MLSNNSLSYEQDQHGFMFTSLAVLPDGSLMAFAVNGGLFRIEAGGQWSRADHDLPAGTVVNRLESDGERAYACTSKGLFLLEENRWVPTRITAPCHRLRGRGNVLYASTDNGLWYKFNDSWVRANYTEAPVYDVFQTPQMVFMAQEKGITVFDRYTQAVDEYPLHTPVSSLCVLNGGLVGASGGGDLMTGDKCGRFELVRYGRIKIFSLASREGCVYACTDRGLYRLLFWKGKYHLCSMKLGFPVTDIAFDKDNFYLATYFEGVYTIPQRREAHS